LERTKAKTLTDFSDVIGFFNFELKLDSDVICFDAKGGEEGSRKARWQGRRRQWMKQNLQLPHDKTPLRKNKIVGGLWKRAWICHAAKTVE